MTRDKLLGFGVFAALAAGCSGSPPPAATQADPPPAAETTEGVAAGPEAMAPAAIVVPPTPLTASEAELARASLDGIAVALHPLVAGSAENVTFSPASIALAFAMLTSGARGTTRDELAHALRFDGGATGADPAASLDALAHAGRQWGGQHTAYELSVANRLFGERTYAFDATYVAATGERFGAPLEAVDFAGAADASRGHINGWVAERTHDRILDLIPGGAIDPSTRLVLVNAIYFHGAWASAFDPARTRPEAFTTAGGETVQVPTMVRAVGPLRHATRSGAEVVELPYQGGELSMTFVLPPAGTSADAWLTTANLALLDDVAESRAELHLPRFRIDPPDSVSLRGALETLGVHAAFSPDADFTGIAPARGTDALRISDAFHKAFVEVNEEGTEAAAATAIVMARGGMPQPVATVRFDRPFLFFLRDSTTRALLFVGRVGRPS